MDKEICCSSFLKIAPKFKWMKLKNSGREILLMPHIVASNSMIRINHCPSCGKNVRDVEIKPEQLEAR